ncbi:L,D-transpeptidase family protein [Flavobacterium sp. Sd200]|uniref:L,D-transpeptidase family protein n=1 Tax=Flavobacterium sp. Sd200 TaxID=2692211 RepID=UPI001369E17E|nr:L,D-transpeptidase family protein [Flavobacterium sp. Sd200]MXN92211.1 L,D-transpeptidase family protein [Flavobacterium sp. Sd200]
MIRPTTILCALLLIVASCQNTGRLKEQLPVQPENTAHLKNTPLALDPILLQNVPEVVKEFYAANGNVTLWTTQDDRKALQQTIADVENDGLLPDDYSLTFLKEFETLTAISEQDCMRYDLMLTEAFTSVTNHLFKGRLKPDGVYTDWALTPKKLDTNKLLTEALQNHNVTEVIDRCRPRHKIYGSLRKSLAYLNTLPNDNTINSIVIVKPITLNDSTSTVHSIKQRLAYWQDLDSIYLNDNVYNAATAVAVKKFQERHGIVADGVVNSRTAQALNFSRNQRKEQVIANLERWRWFPYDFGERAIVINIPDYGLAIVENNKDTIQTYKVVVGKPDRRTPVLQSTLSNLIINPTWTVPPTILKEDLTPTATKDRNHFIDLNMKIYLNNAEVSPWEWDPEKATSYRYVQGPGNHNALGRIKFNFQNNFSVYLHDTNHKENFAKPYRALSSGCVRVQNPFKLAGYVLEKQEAGWTKDKIDEILETGETTNVDIKKSIRVHQLYWTAWMDKDGLQFRNDIYSLDKILYAKLRS